VSGGRSWSGVRRVLAVRLDQLGDVLMTTPALAAMAESWPGVQITLLTSRSGAAAARHLPMLHDTWTCDVPWVAQGAAAAAAQEDGAHGAAEQALVARLAAGRFDAAVIFTVCTQSALPAALLCRMAGIPLRLAASRENPYALLTDWVPETDVVDAGMRHEVQRQLDLVASVGATTADVRLRFTVREEDRRQARALRIAHGLAPEAPYVVVHPGATAESRRWPARRFGQVARAIAQRSGCAVVFAGHGEDLAHVHEALQEVPPGVAVSLAGRLSLGEFAALVEEARVLVGNNSAPAHLAAAVGTPVASLYALTNPQHTPWRVPLRVLTQDVSCRWCLKSRCPQRHHLCLRGVEPPRVVDAVLELLRRQPLAALAALESTA
jgi:lipopolysaccharide heptosyltransferase II